ncbi:hypothetical protein ACFL59_16600, partial [Planctomycetota bacterium]
MGGAAPGSSRLPYLAATVLGALVAAMILGSALREGHALSAHDAGHQFPAVKQRVAAALLRAELPLWNPAVACGVPTLANPNAQAFYPGILCFLPFDPFAGLKLFTFLHLALIPAAFMALARSFGIGAL